MMHLNILPEQYTVFGFDSNPLFGVKQCINCLVWRIFFVILKADINKSTFFYHLINRLHLTFEPLVACGMMTASGQLVFLKTVFNLLEKASR